MLKENMITGRNLMKPMQPLSPPSGGIGISNFGTLRG